jgi:DNA-binding response OmpR family regulator
MVSALAAQHRAIDVATDGYRIERLWMAGYRGTGMTDNEKILVVDDDAHVRQSLAAILEEEGYAIVTAQDGPEALRRLYAEKPALVLLDIVMPGMDGWEVCRRIRELTEVPIIILTARGQVQDRVRGLDLGADDYLVKPVMLDELQARVRSALRRGRRSPTTMEPEALSFDRGRLVVDTRAGEIWVEGQRLKMRPLDYRLLVYLARNAGQLLTHNQILDAVWGHEYTGDRASLKLYVWRLRQKIERSTNDPHYIQTERGIGYRFMRPD